MIVPRNNRAVASRPGQRNTLQTVKNVAAAAAAAALAKMGYDVGSTSRVTGTKRSRSGTSKKETKVVHVATQRGSGSKKVIKKYKKSRGKKITLKKRVQRLEKNKPSLSYYTYYDTRPYVSILGVNKRKICQLRLIRTDDVETHMATVEFPTATVNMTSKNTTIPVKAHAKMTLVNGSVRAMDIKWVIVECADDTIYSPLDNLAAHQSDRALASPVVNGEIATDASQSYIMGNIEYGIEKFCSVQMSAAYNNATRHWKLGKKQKVQSLRLNPGDTFDIYYNDTFRYKPEQKDQQGANATYFKGQDSFLLIDYVGELAHGSTKTLQIGTGTGQIDAQLCVKYTFTIQNGLGLHNKIDINHGNYTAPDTVYVQAGADNIVE